MSFIVYSYSSGMSDFLDSVGSLRVRLFTSHEVPVSNIMLVWVRLEVAIWPWRSCVSTDLCD